MKIIRDEKSYIQLRDLEVMLKLRCAVPAEIFEAMLKYQTTFTDDNRDEFIEFNSENARYFLKSYEAEWILDLDENYNLSDEAFNNRSIAIALAINGFKDKTMSRQDALIDKFKRQYRLSTLHDIQKIRQGTSKLQLPVELKKEQPKIMRKEKNRGEI